MVETVEDLLAQLPQQRSAWFNKGGGVSDVLLPRALHVLAVPQDWLGEVLHLE